uniref:Uncharacterized protein n=1 Tax=Anopheles maculatus TaxID=74869 RepID=A0A182SU96_9DIPT
MYGRDLHLSTTLNPREQKQHQHHHHHHPDGFPAGSPFRLPLSYKSHLIRLLYRTGLLFVSNVLCHTFYLVYVNTDDLTSGGYLFSGNSIALFGPHFDGDGLECVVC